LPNAGRPLPLNGWPGRRSGSKAPGIVAVMPLHGTASRTFRVEYAVPPAPGPAWSAMCRHRRGWSNCRRSPR